MSANYIVIHCYEILCYLYYDFKFSPRYWNYLLFIDNALLLLSYNTSSVEPLLMQPSLLLFQNLVNGSGVQVPPKLPLLFQAHRKGSQDKHVSPNMAVVAHRITKYILITTQSSPQRHYYSFIHINNRLILSKNDIKHYKTRNPPHSALG